MKFLKDLNTIYLTELDDNSAMPSQNLKDLQKLITTGASNSGSWSNALELVHKAYTISNEQRPTPDMKAAWIQYETLIAFAVTQLSKFHGQHGNWRMTSESFIEKNRYQVSYMSPNSEPDIIEIEAYNVNEIVEYFDIVDTKTKQITEDFTLVEFWQHGIIKSKSYLEITEMNQGKITNDAN